MSKRKPDKKDTELVNESEKNKQIYPNASNSPQNSKSSPQPPNTETQIRRPRGRPRKNQNNNLPLPANDHKNSTASAQSSPLLPMPFFAKPATPTNITVQTSEGKKVDGKTHSIPNSNDDDNQRSHHAKAGNILYKNIHSTTNTSKNGLNAPIHPSSNTASSSTTASFSGFNYIVTHSRLETIETRINDKLIPEMIHPAQSIVYDRLHQESLLLNEKEYNKRKNYRIVHTLKRIPACWEPRPWDKPEEKMTKFENFEFTEMIDSFEPLDSDGEIREWYRSKEVRAATRQKKRVPVMFEVSMISYSTDEFDDQTDFDSF